MLRFQYIHYVQFLTATHSLVWPTRFSPMLYIVVVFSGIDTTLTLAAERRPRIHMSKA